VLCVPLVGLSPDHAPEAVHVVALELQTSVVVPPGGTELRIEWMVSVASGWAHNTEVNAPRTSTVSIRFPGVMTAVY
jgi:hypothetical protein